MIRVSDLWLNIDNCNYGISMVFSIYQEEQPSPSPLTFAVYPLFVHCECVLMQK